jgi:hypothetical protein
LVKAATPAMVCLSTGVSPVGVLHDLVGDGLVPP